jgi:uncharacterized protein (TIGR02145 family)
MSKKSVLIAFFSVSLCLSFAQRTTIELTFTAVNDTDRVQLNSVRIINRTQGGETVIYWPDTSISLEITPGDLYLYIGHATYSPVGVREIIHDINQFRLFQNYPNPAKDQTYISLYVPETGMVDLLVTDAMGRAILSESRHLEPGNHSFRFIPGDAEVYFLTARRNGISKNIKIITTASTSSQGCTLDYQGISTENHISPASFKSVEFISGESGILDVPDENKTYTFQFAANIPCPGTPTVDYEGKVYNTIQVFSQCWLSENLDVGTMIWGNQEMTHNGIIEKYCYDNSLFNCLVYGGLYLWPEMMQYGTLEGIQGICPPGWHVPADEEWKVLEGIADSQFKIGNPEWDIYNAHRGYDVAMNLKSTSGWYENENGTDLYGFSALPGGYRSNGTFWDSPRGCGWWTSSQYSTSEAWSRYIDYNKPGVSRMYYYKSSFGMSVRCLKDD